MSENKEDQQPPVSRGSRRPSKDTLNLIIASCAVLISAASFVAAYLQSDAAYRQVKAETWPYLQLESSNFDTTTNSSVISLRLENAGVGPANVKSFTLYYDNQVVKTFWHFAQACCGAEGSDIRTTIGDYVQQSPDAPIVTASVSGTILPSGAGKNLFIVPRTNSNEALWSKLNSVRHKLTAKSCYCSLLGECYLTDFKTDPVEVHICPANKDPEYSG